MLVCLINSWPYGLRRPIYCQKKTFCGAHIIFDLKMANGPYLKNSLSYVLVTHISEEPRPLLRHSMIVNRLLKMRILFPGFFYMNLLGVLT